MGETHHYHQRCFERRIPTNASGVAKRHGRRYRGRRGERIYHIDSYRAWGAKNLGIDLYDYQNIAVIHDRRGVPITVFRVSSDEARRRWEEYS